MKSREEHTFRYYPVLSKIHIMIPVSLTGFTGYFLYKPQFTPGLFFVTAGILLLAVAASVLNQIQEKEYDRLMERTRFRPLPAGKISVKQAYLFFSLTLIGGITFLLLAKSITALLISLFTIFWYNGIYTYLKRITRFAVIPGALTGALPPLIGWVAAGGTIASKQIILLQLLLFTGQIPHFWLFILKYGKEYELAGFPSLTRTLENHVIKKLIFTFVAITAGIAAGFNFYELLKFNVARIVIYSAALLLIILFISILSRNSKKPEFYSAALNLFFLIILAVLIYDRISG